MATAKKLASGSWHILVFSHFETVKQPDGSEKTVRRYKSFTVDDPGPKGKAKCEKLAADWKLSHAVTSRSKSSMKFKDAFRMYIDAKSNTLSPRTVHEYERCYKAGFGSLDNVPLDRITSELLQNVVNEKCGEISPRTGRKLSSKTITNWYGNITAVLGLYMPDNRYRVTLPQKTKPKLYVPTDEEVQRILAFTEGTPMEIPVLLAAFGPMRRSEISAMRVEDFKGNIGNVKHAMVLNNNDEWVIKVPKSYAGDRFIEFPDFVISKLPKSGPVTDLNPDEISHRFPHILQKLGIHNFRFHDLRHWCASTLHDWGFADKIICDRGGWSDSRVLQQIYLHAKRDRIDQTNKIASEKFTELYNSK